MSEEKKQLAIDVLLNALDVLLKEFKDKEETDKITEEIVKSALDANILYCRFVSEHYNTTADDLAVMFDEWMSQLSEEDIAEMCRPDAPSVDSKIDAESSEVYYTLEEIMNPFNNPPESGAKE